MIAIGQKIQQNNKSGRFVVLFCVFLSPLLSLPLPFPSSQLQKHTIPHPPSCSCPFLMHKLKLTPLQIKEKHKREVRQRTNARVEALFLEEEKEQRKIADGIEGIEEDLIEVREALETVRQNIDLIVFLLVLLIFSFVFRFL